MKTCPKCKADKPNTEFNKHASRKGGLQYICKACKVVQNAAYRAAKPDKAAAYKNANREKAAAYSAEYRAANPEKIAAHSRNRRARNRNAEGKHTATDIRAIFDAQRGLCASCLCKLFKSGKQKFHVDHMVPLSKGGSNDKYNLQCLCPTCNMSKRAKDPIDWAQKMGKLL